MLRVLKAPENIAYQRALLTSELREVFKNAPPIPDAHAESSTDGNRKPIEGDCPICKPCGLDPFNTLLITLLGYEEFETDKEAIVYCRAGCGNNVHKNCMDSWGKASKGKVTCPYCRCNWFDTDLSGSKVDLKTATMNADGYYNLAPQLGLSGERGMLSWTFWHICMISNMCASRLLDISPVLGSSATWQYPIL